MKMEHTKLLTKLNHLPIEMQSEVNDFIDFLISRKKKKISKKKPTFGSAKGQITISTDFDEPLEDFTEYM